MIKQALGCVVVFGCLMASASLQAHHSTAAVYDPAKEGKVTGTLAKIQFVNPHGSITITVKNADGTTTDWTFTTGSANGARPARDHQSRPEGAEDRRRVDRVVHPGTERESIGRLQVAYAGGRPGPR